MCLKGLKRHKVLSRAFIQGAQFTVTVIRRNDDATGCVGKEEQSKSIATIADSRCQADVTVSRQKDDATDSVGKAKAAGASQELQSKCYNRR